MSSQLGADLVTFASEFVGEVVENMRPRKIVADDDRRRRLNAFSAACRA